MLIKISNYLPEEPGFSDFLNCQRFGKVQQLLSFAVFLFDFDKADTLLRSVIKTYQSGSVQARIDYNNKLPHSFNGLKQQRLISITQAYISIVGWQDVLGNPSEFRNGLHNPSEARMIEGPLFLIL